MTFQLKLTLVVDELILLAPIGNKNFNLSIRTSGTTSVTQTGFKMPAGISWPRYLRMLTASMLSMFAGAQVVHQYYRPDLVSVKFCAFLVHSLQRTMQTFVVYKIAFSAKNQQIENILCINECISFYYRQFLMSHQNPGSWEQNFLAWKKNRQTHNDTQNCVVITVHMHIML